MTGWLGLDGRRALVVGAGGFGTACAHALLGQGVRVHVADRDAGTLDRLAGSGASGEVCDITDPAACDRLVANAVRAFDGLDILIHAAGVNDRRPLLELDTDAWRTVLEINLTSAFHVGRAAGRVLCDQGAGRVVLFSSVSGRLAHPDHGPYAASKGGLDQLLRVMAIEWASHGVTVNAVAPGYTASPLTDEHLARPGVRDELVSKVPAGRLGTLDDAVGPVLFLCSDHASFVTGQVLYVDGGRTLD